MSLAFRSQSAHVHWRRRGARRRRARGPRRKRRAAPAAQPALERQAKAADSAAQAVASAVRARAAVRQGRGRGARSRAAADTAKRIRDSIARANGAGALDRRGYFDGKLDLDVATCRADRLIARRERRSWRDASCSIAWLRGPFVTRDGLRRVTGVGPASSRRSTR